MTTENILESEGYCSTCNQMVSFVAKNAWLRDHFFAQNVDPFPGNVHLCTLLSSFILTGGI